MRKDKIIRRIAASLFYIVGIFFAIYYSLLIIEGRVLIDIDGVIITMLVVCIPIAIATLLLILGTEEIAKRCKVMRVFILITLVFYSILLVGILFRNGIRHSSTMSNMIGSNYWRLNTNFIPFKTIITYIEFFINDSINKSIILKNILGNLLLFAPMGVLLPCIFQRLRKFRVFFIIMLVILICVEVTQILTGSGSCDIDDVILNSLGAILFFGLYNLKVVQKLLKSCYVLE